MSLLQYRSRTKDKLTTIGIKWIFTTSTVHTVCFSMLPIRLCAILVDENEAYREIASSDEGGVQATRPKPESAVTLA